MTECLAIDLIHTDGGTQSRAYFNELVISEYHDAMVEGAIFPPVVVFYDGTHYWLVDGFHRLAAAKQCGRPTLDVTTTEGSRREAILYAAGTNATHGLRRTNADKRKTVTKLLEDKEWQQWSNREIARRCGVTHTFVSKLRRELVTKSHMADTVEMNSLTDDSASATATDTTWAAQSKTESVYPPVDTNRVDPDEPFTVRSHTVIKGEGEVFSELQPGLSEKSTIDVIAAASQQTPAEWVGEMMAYWLSDLQNRYDGITSNIIRQATEMLLEQYEEVQRDIARSD